MRRPWPDLLRPRIAARQKQSFDRQADHSKKKQFFLKQGVDILLLIADSIHSFFIRLRSVREVNFLVRVAGIETCD